MSMLNKPFRPPSFKKSDSSVTLHNDFHSPPAKRQKLRTSTGHDEDDPQLNSLHYSRNPLQSIGRSVALPDLQCMTTDASAEERYYNVLWSFSSYPSHPSILLMYHRRKPTAKKHKTWDGDGILVVNNGFAHLQDVSGRSMGKATCSKPLLIGSALVVGGKEVEVESLVSKKDYRAGRPFLGTEGRPTVKDLENQLRTDVAFGQAKRALKPHSESSSLVDLKVEDVPESSRSLNVSLPQTKALQTQFKNPLLEKTIFRAGDDQKPIPRHDPNAPQALVMKRPASYVRGKQIVDVVVDPHISQKLREHQREGVKFMYECVMGMRPHGGEGAILADEMGLGKTLQVIALLWTLLKQNPFYEDPPVVKKALIVCPVTLIKNWRKEFRKWLGTERVGVFVVEDNKKRITDFTLGRAYSIMIIGYEKLRLVQAELQNGPGIDIVVADEGHRLKTAQNKSAQAIRSLKTERRIILSGTPLQNDLSEFYFMVDFVNPGLLEKPGVFKREFETPILRSRQPEASAKDVEKGVARSAELAALTSKFILRRTADILAKYLPPRTETVLFCRPTSIQAAVYRNVLESPMLSAVLRSPEASLKLINVLKKLCNSPSLLKGKAIAEEGCDDSIASLLSAVTPNLLKSPGASGKLQVLDNLLYRLRSLTDEKIVIVSNYTATLDILGNLLSSLSYTFLRLDGSTAVSKRQDLVDRFNRSDAKTYFAFLLSAKAGGTGLNLIGASRLVLFDVDWNPSTDLQAMARIHRDGQKRPCKIYRLITMGALDEKIYQRQLMKRSLADSVVDNKVSVSTFTREELRNLFALDESAKCQTHELLGCMCDGKGASPPVSNSEPDENLPCESDDESDLSGARIPELVKASRLDMELQEQRLKEQCLNGKASKSKILELMQFQHFDTSNFVEGITGDVTTKMDDDDVLRNVLTDKENRVAYMFTRTTS